MDRIDRNSWWAGGRRVLLLVDDDLGVIVAESENPGQRRVGRIHVVKGADPHPIKPLSLSVD
jgi:hypothetical protein